MTLKELKEDIKYFCEKGHEISNHLAFAGIAIAWIFIESIDNIKLTAHMLMALIAFILTIGITLFHYVLFSVLYSLKYRSTPQGNNEEKTYVKSLNFANFAGWISQILKIFILAFGYIHLYFFLIEIVSQKEVLSQIFS